MRLSRLLLALPALLLLAPLVRADDTEEFLKPDNWEGRSDIWKIEKGTITGETKEDPGYNTFFISKKKYGDFELSYKVKLTDDVGNSGVQIRSTRVDKDDDKKPFRVSGPQVDAAKGYHGLLYGEGVGGYMQKPTKDFSKAKEFNEYKVVVKGNHYTISVNGEVANDGDFPDNGGKNPAPKEGIIAFQVHAGVKSMKVEYTDIKFTDLSKKK
jgi:hypothetical protein